MSGFLHQARRGPLLFGLLLCATPVAAEVHRFGPQDIMAVLNAQGTLQITTGKLAASGNIVRLAPDDIIGKLPRALGFDLGEPSPADATAVFAVHPRNGEAEDALSVRIERGTDGMHRVAAADRDGLGAWLLERISNFMTNEVVVSLIDGFDGEARVLFGTEGATPGGSPPAATFHSGLGDLVGRSLADVSFAGLDGRSRIFADFAGSVVLVHIWATWCLPCIADMPVLEALETKYADRGLRVVNLSDEPAEVIEQWLDDNPTPMLHGRRDDFAFLVDEPTDENGTHRVARPTHLVLGRDGTVLEAGAGAIVSSQGSSDDNHHLARLVEPYL